MEITKNYSFQPNAIDYFATIVVCYISQDMQLCVCVFVCVWLQIIPVFTLELVQLTHTFPIS